MSRKSDIDLLAELDSLGVDPSSPSNSTTNPPPQPKPTLPKPPILNTPQPSSPSNDDDNILRDLQAQLAAKPTGPSVSRPGTPRGSSSSTSKRTGTGGTEQLTPTSSGPPSGRTSEERLRTGNVGQGQVQARTSGEGSRAYHQARTPEPQQQEVKVESTGGGGGWWGGFGGLLSTATAAVKQAETLAKEISGNEEALRWAEQVRGNVKSLQTFGTDLTSRALPTFTSLISTIAPPISAHERLVIHSTHDILGYPSLDPLIYSTFSRIMSQVEGGDLLVIQRGSEQRSRASSEPQGYRGGVLGTGQGGWTDGPWWRDEQGKRSLGTVQGLREGSRLCRVSAESYAHEFFDSRGGVEAVAQKATESLDQSNPTRSSDIFLGIQAVSYKAEKELFADDGRGDEGGEVDGEDEEEEVCFAIYLHDPLHSLSFSGLSQPFPAKWVGWLDASNNQGEGGLPEDIQEIISSGGVDPREWVAEWMEEILATGVGIVAQRYVARRMGVGEGGIGRGKRRVEESDVSGEAARAI
ncbi:hypothetical protein LTR56_002496 [Elasticomyces elasticus]|nr:hypothetical protein LTR22_020209 [Elasticomyces elasticus]KAK3657354.1 hypothetical protein LTR56_002496 [Elasticomyces elasticus]KAK4933549.1 hypothetical protein LTR49_000011 [Elasticomyces elasticus]KAK5754810.1 hypothetical protein LTS12_015127 [Elasticomyces elasticus]